MRIETFQARRPTSCRSRIPRALSAAVLIGAVVILAAGCSPKKEDNAQGSQSASNVTLTAAQKEHLRFYTVTRTKFHRTIEANGSVDFDNDQATSVLAPFSGPVSRLLVSSGEKVKKGDPLAEVDSPDFATAISTYSKALATAKTSRKLADTDKDLVEHDGIAQREARQAETDAVNAEADRDAARQTLVSLNVDPKTIIDIQQGRPVSRVTGVIRSPITGTVVEKLITPGQLLQAGTTPSFTVADLSRVWVLAQIASSDLALVSLHDPAEVDPGLGSNKLNGIVDNISALVDPNTRTVVARVVVENPGDVLKKQMYVRVSIRARQESIGLMVPVSAILRDDENLPFVYIAQRDGSFARQHVTLGYREGGQYDIPHGLKVGDRVVVDGGLFVQFMQSQ